MWYSYCKKGASHSLSRNSNNQLKYMSEAATPAAPSTEAPVAPAATPATPAAPVAPATQPESVTLTKEQHDQLQRDAARARQNQGKADRYDRLVGSGKAGHFTPQSQAPVTPPTAEELAEKARNEDQKAERGLIALAVDPKYRELLDSDPTLRDMLTKNPLALLPTLAPDAIDAEDAISLVAEALGQRAAGIKKPETPPATPPAPTPPAGAVNPQTDLPNLAAQEALKNPNTEQAVSGSIKERLKQMGGKSS